MKKHIDADGSFVVIILVGIYSLSFTYVITASGLNNAALVLMAMFAKQLECFGMVF